MDKSSMVLISHMCVFHFKGKRLDWRFLVGTSQGYVNKYHCKQVYKLRRYRTCILFGLHSSNKFPIFFEFQKNDKREV